MPDDKRWDVPAEDAPAGAPVLDGYAHPGFKWLDDIECKDNNLGEFFANAGHVLSEEARSACMKCSVWRECLIFSYMGTPDSKPITGGYFAGFSPGQRKKLELGEAVTLGEQARARRAAPRRSRQRRPPAS